MVVDAGSGNAYLGFILYELFLKDAAAGTMLSSRRAPELTERAKERAQRLGFARMEFQTAHLETAQWPERIHLLTALHACDTATDDALAVAIQHRRGPRGGGAVLPGGGGRAAQGRSGRGGRDAGRCSSQHPWHRREFGSHLTNVIRALMLEAYGYQVTVTELTGWEHSLKNELILGRRVHRENRQARAKLEALLGSFGVQPKLARLLNMGPAAAAKEPPKTETPA